MSGICTETFQPDIFTCGRPEAWDFALYKHPSIQQGVLSRFIALSSVPFKNIMFIATVITVGYCSSVSNWILSLEQIVMI